MEEVTSENRFKSHICSKTLTTKQNLERQIRIHTGEKPFECEICGQRFPQSSHLKNHQKIHTGEKTFKCDVCGKQFTHKRSLYYHLKIHTGEKNFVCNICEKSFTRKADLDRHLKIHTGEKPYQCKVCEKSFSQKGSLNRHMVVHTGEKPYSCERCGKSYADRCGLRYHKKSCNGQSSSQQNETLLKSKTESEVEEVMDDPNDDYDLSENKKCIGQSSSQEKETTSTSKIQDDTELKGEEVMDDPSDNSDLSENNLVIDSNYDLKSKIGIDEFKLEAISEEDNVMIELPTQVTDNQISDIIKSETSESEENSAQKEMSDTTSYNPYLCVQCWNSFSLESDYINHKTTCHGNTSSLQNQVTASTSHNLQFVDCGETIKEEIKEEVDEEYQRDPLRLSNAVQSLDEPVTYEEFICEG